MKIITDLKQNFYQRLKNNKERNQFKNHFQK